jgi:hypothetical protein
MGWTVGNSAARVDGPEAGCVEAHTSGAHSVFGHALQIGAMAIERKRACEVMAALETLKLAAGAFHAAPLTR